MSEIKRAKPVRKSSNSSISSRASNVSFSEKVRRESTAKFDNFMKECRAAYLAVLSSTTEKITSIDELILGKNGFPFMQYWLHLVTSRAGLSNESTLVVEIGTLFPPSLPPKKGKEGRKYIVKYFTTSLPASFLRSLFFLLGMRLLLCILLNYSSHSLKSYDKVVSSCRV